MSLFAIAGVTGNTGAATARALLARGHRLRVIARDPAKAGSWAAQAAEVAVADLADAQALTRALTGVDGAYLLNPPAYQSGEPLAVAARVGAALSTAVTEAAVPRTVVLSSIGGHLPAGTGIIGTAHVLERAVAGLDAMVTILRAPYFLENFLGVLAVARDQGFLPTMLTVDQALDMIPVADIGEAAADILTGSTRDRVVELHGAAPVSPRDVAAALAAVLGRPIQAVPVPRQDWEGVLAGWGLDPATRALYAAMHDAINDGTVRWEGTTAVTGRTSLADWAAALPR